MDEGSIAPDLDALNTAFINKLRCKIDSVTEDNWFNIFKATDGLSIFREVETLMHRVFSHEVVWDHYIHNLQHGPKKRKHSRANMKQVIPPSESDTDGVAAADILSARPQADKNAPPHQVQLVRSTSAADLFSRMKAVDARTAR